MGSSKNALFPRLRRQRRAPILMYDLYTAVARTVLPCTHEKITICRDALHTIYRRYPYMERVYFRFIWRCQSIK